MFQNFFEQTLKQFRFLWYFLTKTKHFFSSFEFFWGFTGKKFADQKKITKNLVFHFQIKLVNIRPEDIVEGNGKLTLGLIWTIILNFQVSVIRQRLLLESSQHEQMSAKHTTTNSQVLLLFFNNAINKSNMGLGFWSEARFSLKIEVRRLFPWLYLSLIPYSICVKCAFCFSFSWIFNWNFSNFGFKALTFYNLHLEFCQRIPFFSDFYWGILKLVL